MASKPNNIIFRKAIQQVYLNCLNNYTKCLGVTGPILFASVANKIDENIYKNIQYIFDGEYYKNIKSGKKICKYKSFHPHGMFDENVPHYSTLCGNNDIYSF